MRSKSDGTLVTLKRLDRVVHQANLTGKKGYKFWPQAKSNEEKLAPRSVLILNGIFLIFVSPCFCHNFAGKMLDNGCFSDINPSDLNTSVYYIPGSVIINAFYFGGLNMLHHE